MILPFPLIKTVPSVANLILLYLSLFSAIPFHDFALDYYFFYPSLLASFHIHLIFLQFIVSSLPHLALSLLINIFQFLSTCYLFFSLCSFFPIIQFHLHLQSSLIPAPSRPAPRHFEVTFSADGDKLDSLAGDEVESFVDVGDLVEPHLTTVWLREGLARDDLKKI